MALLNEIGAALKNVVLMQASIERLERCVERQGHDIAGLRDAIAKVSERVVRIETMIEMTTARAGQPPRIEGQ